MSVVHAFIFLFSLLGKYTIDPNEGCSSDAVEVYCDFEKQATCVNPKKSKVRDLINLLLLSDCSTLLLLFFIVVGIFSVVTSALLLISIECYRRQRNRTWTMDKRGRTGKSCLIKSGNP